MSIADGMGAAIGVGAMAAVLLSPSHPGAPGWGGFGSGGSRPGRSGTGWSTRTGSRRRSSSLRAFRGRGPGAVGRRPVRPDRHGGRSPARWARRRDLRRLTVPERGDEAVTTGRVVLGRAGRQLVAAESAQSVIVFGPTQSYKTSGFAIPAVLGWDGPVVAASVKADLLEHTVERRRSLGEVLCFDPTGSTGVGSASWSPLPFARTWPGARRAAAGMTEVVKTSGTSTHDGDFWYATAARMLAPLLFAASHGRLGMDDVIRWVATEEEHEVLDLLAETGVIEAFEAARSTFGKEERQRSSIYTTVETVLEPFTGSAASAGATGSVGTTFDGTAHDGVEPRAVDPVRLVAGINTLYLCAPAHDQRRLTPLFVSLLRTVVEHVYDQVPRTRRPLDPPLLLVLDEAANIAPLDDLDGLAATAAGHGVQLVTIWHDLAQITARYGPRATTVVNNHRAKLFLSGISDPATLDYASRLIGEEEVVLPSTTTGGQAGPTTTRARSTRWLVPPDTLRRTPPGQGVLVYGDLPPARLTLQPWYAGAHPARSSVRSTK